MLRKNIHVGKRGFISGLAKDESGNVIMIMAAAIIPLLAITGGAIDTSRVYMAKDRLQAACDAGVLAGRKAMLGATFTGDASARAQQMFSANYVPGYLGTTNSQLTVTSVTAAPSGSTVAVNTGEISGQASAVVPTIMMRIFGKDNVPISANCDADLQIPNLDIMMVLDVTGSMGWCPAGPNATCDVNGVMQSRIVSLRQGIKDFYSTIKAQTSGNDKTIVRYGFVPYTSAVNGSRLFSNSPQSHQISAQKLSSTHNYASRVAVFSPTTTTPTVAAAVAVPNTKTVTYETFTITGPAIVNNTLAQVSATAGTKISFGDCTGESPAPPGEGFSVNRQFTINGTGEAGQTSPGQGNTVWSPGFFSAVNVAGPVVYKLANNTYTATAPTSGSYQRINFEIVTEHAKRWNKKTENIISNYNYCTRRVTKENFVFEQPAPVNKFTGWIYKDVSYDLTNYKVGSPLQFVSKFDEATAYVNTPGEYSPQQLVGSIRSGAPVTSTVSWGGCLEEPNTEATDDFTPFPDGALDLKYKDIPSTNEAYWKPMLGTLVLSRPSTLSITNASNLYVPTDHANTKKYLPADVTYQQPECPAAPATNLNVMSQTEVNTYADSLQPSGATYHDIGMVWGLRLLSKRGIFSNRNVVGTNGSQISRHIVFMTDGELSPADYYTAWGVEKTNKRITGTLSAGEASLHADRFQALCSAAKDPAENIIIHVIAFGTSLTTNLSECASPGQAYSAADTTGLNAAFQRIATSIADLRLTQ